MATFRPAFSRCTDKMVSLSLSLSFCFHIEWIPCIRLDYVEKEYVGLVRVSEIDRTREYNENGSYKIYVLWIIVRDI